MTAQDPLAALLDHVERGDGVPLGWVVAHAPDGDLAWCWAASREPLAVFALGAPTVPPRQRLAALVACARLVEPALPRRAAHTVGLALTRLEAFCRGAAKQLPRDPTHARVMAAFGETARTPPHAHAAGAVSALLQAAGMCTAAADAHCVGCAAELFRHAARAVDATRDVALASVPAEVIVADRLRAVLPCPTLDQVRAAHARG